MELLLSQLRLNQVKSSLTKTHDEPSFSLTTARVLITLFFFLQPHQVLGLWMPCLEDQLSSILFDYDLANGAAHNPGSS